MTDFARDPMGFNLMTWNKPKVPEAKPKPPPPPPAPKPAPAPTYFIQPYMMPPYHCHNNFYPQSCYGMPMFVQNIHPHYVMLPPPPPPPPPAEKPKQHVCVNCSDKKKCKACVKIEDAKKKYISKPTFFNPRVKK